MYIYTYTFTYVYMIEHEEREKIRVHGALMYSPLRLVKTNLMDKC